MRQGVLELRFLIAEKLKGRSRKVKLELPMKLSAFAALFGGEKAVTATSPQKETYIRGKYLPLVLFENGFQGHPRGLIFLLYFIAIKILKHPNLERFWGFNQCRDIESVLCQSRSVLVNK